MDESKLKEVMSEMEFSDRILEINGSEPLQKTFRSVAFSWLMSGKSPKGTLIEAVTIVIGKGLKSPYQQGKYVLATMRNMQQRTLGPTAKEGVFKNAN